VQAREILDSRGTPTVAVDVRLEAADRNWVGRDAHPTGADEPALASISGPLPSTAAQQLRRT